MRHLVIHGHFYQPPREEPWLELVPREPTAAPDHDWNARITRECYAPLAHARVLDHAGRIRRLINAYSYCSFNVGPTLFKWFDEHAPDVGHAFVAADAESATRLGHGNAIATPYHHIIMPLASRRDKVTEVRWGIRDFRHRFGREPLGMWLPETAVDSETLEVLVDEGIRFTVLAPHQVEAAPASGRAGRWHGRDGRELAIYAYDGVQASAVAFGDALTDAKHWERLLRSAPVAPDGEPTITSLATDGETFGHHHRFGDLALASLIDQVEGDPTTAFTNFAVLLEAFPAQSDVVLVEETSWSCAHGIDRWRLDCGCRNDPMTNQAWRSPLRAGLEVLAQAIHVLTEQLWPPAAGDLHEMRNLAGPDLAGVTVLPIEARRLLEAERHSLAMFTSCAWFFDDLARLEPRIVLRHAARAMEFLPEAKHDALETALLSALAGAHSNDPSKGDGVAVWYRDVMVEADGPARLAAGLAALRDTIPEALDELILPSHTWYLDGEMIVTRHRNTGYESRWMAHTTILGVVAEQVTVTPAGPSGGPVREIPINAFPGPVRELLLQAARPMVFDAALSTPARDQLRDGMFHAQTARRQALSGAWRLVEQDGLEDAGILVHAVLDLYDLEEVPYPDNVRVEAFERLAHRAGSTMRATLASRLALTLPEQL